MKIDTKRITRLTITIPENIDASDVTHALNRVGAGFGDTLKISSDRKKITVDLQGQNQEAQRKQALFILGNLAEKQALKAKQ